MNVQVPLSESLLYISTLMSTQNSAQQTQFPSTEFKMRFRMKYPLASQIDPAGRPGVDEEGHGQKLPGVQLPARAQERALVGFGKSMDEGLRDTS
jgi:hypothetical protein